MGALIAALHPEKRTLPRRSRKERFRNQKLKFCWCSSIHGSKLNPDKDLVMTFDVPELLIIALTALLFWIGGRDWILRHRGPRH
jgi:hypothetical protein